MAAASEIPQRRTRNCWPSCSRHWIFLFGPLFTSIAVWAAIIVILIVWQNPPGWTNYPVVILALIPGLWLLGRYVRWRSYDVALTSTRILVRQGIFGRDTVQLRLQRITEVNIRQELFERLLGTGSLVIDVQGEDDSMTLEYMRKPAIVQRVINSQINEIVGGGHREPIPADMLPREQRGSGRHAPDDYYDERPHGAPNDQHDTPPFGVGGVGDRGDHHQHRPAPPKRPARRRPPRPAPPPKAPSPSRSATASSSSTTSAAAASSPKRSSRPRRASCSIASDVPRRRRPTHRPPDSRIDAWHRRWKTPIYSRCGGERQEEDEPCTHTVVHADIQRRRPRRGRGLDEDGASRA